MIDNNSLDIRGEISEPADIQVVSASDISANDSLNDKPGVKSIFPISKSIFILIAVALITSCLSFSLIVLRTQNNIGKAGERCTNGMTAMINGDLDLALFEFTEALKLNPSIKGAHRALGQIALTNGRASDAAKHFEAELKINRSDLFSHMALGCLYSIGLIPKDDPHNLKTYLLQAFPKIVPAYWRPDLSFIPPEGVDPLSTAINHFQYCIQADSSDPAPRIGVAFAHLANYNLAAARQKLSTLYLNLVDNPQIEDETIEFVNRVISDINEEEQYIAWLETNNKVSSQQGTHQSPAPEQQIESSEAMPDLSSKLSELPPLSDNPEMGPLPPLPQSPASGDTTFGNRYDNSDTQNRENLSLRLTEQDLIPQPTVKPINNDIQLKDSNQRIKTVRLANIYESGSVGFREGETIIMPNTNVEVKVIEYKQNKIVLEERGHRFVWVPSPDVGWMLENTPINASPPLNITAVKPKDKDKQQDDESANNSANNDDLGPEVKPD